MGKWIASTLKGSIRAVLLFSLRLRWICATWLRIVKEVLYGQGYSSTRMDFAKILSENRLHVTEPLFDSDFDITFVDYGTPTPALDKELLALAEASARGLREYNQSLSKRTAMDPLGAWNVMESASDMRHVAFAQIPELRASDNHYMLLLVIAEALNARRVVEVGTASGSSLCSFLSSPAVEFVNTFDLVPLASNRAWLRQESLDVVDKLLADNHDRWSQHVVNLSDESVWLEHVQKFADADIVFIDADHSGVLEALLAARLAGVLKPSAVVIWDDIRLSSMVHFWQKLGMHKLDLGGLGHISGTGISRVVT
jgi:predicted O-methyltransferase YrrM